MKDTLQDLFNSTERIIQLYFKIIFLETCFYHNVTPKGLRIKKKSQSIRKDDVQKRWDGVLGDTEKILLKITIEEEIVSMKIEEKEFWDSIEILRNLREPFITADWLAKLQEHSSKLKRKLTFQKSRKLNDLQEQSGLEGDMVGRF